MSLSNIISRDLKQRKIGETGEYDISVRQFDKIKQFLEVNKVKFSFNSSLGKLNVLMPSFIHSTGATWLDDWVQRMMLESGHLKKDGVKVKTDATLKGFTGRYLHSEKIPDAGLLPRGRKWPTLAIEVGYSESYEKLLEDATLLLEGSEGKIGLVILVKLAPLKENETTLQFGFVEVHSFNKETGKRENYKGRMGLYPPPATHARQKLVLTWEQLLRNKIHEKTSEADPPPLRLDDLRKAMAEDVERHLKFDDKEDDDNSEKE